MSYFQAQVTHSPDPDDVAEWSDVYSGNPDKLDAARDAFAHCSTGGRWRVVEISEAVVMKGTAEEEPS